MRMLFDFRSLEELLNEKGGELRLQGVVDYRPFRGNKWQSYVGEFSLGLYANFKLFGIDPTSEEISDVDVLQAVGQVNGEGEYIVWCPRYKDLFEACRPLWYCVISTLDWPSLEDIENSQ